MTYPLVGYIESAVVKRAGNSLLGCHRQTCKHYKKPKLINKTRICQNKFNFVDVAGALD